MSVKTKPDSWVRHLKANVRGSWSNVMSFHLKDESDVKAACVILVKAAHWRLSFKLEDSSGVQIAHLDEAWPVEWKGNGK